MSALAADRDTVSGLLAGRTCVVTGASRGIGRGIATELGRHGAAVVVNYRSSADRATEVVETIDATDGEGTAVAVRADVSEPEHMADLSREAHDAFGPIDVLVNNAGITADTTFEEMTREEWDRVMAVNLGGVFNCTKAFYEDLHNADAGRLINVSSVVGQQGNYGQANYAATKSGLFGFTRTLALELASTGTTANCVAPGFTRTEMLETVPERVQEHIRDRIPLDRFAAVEDIAGIVRFLASDAAAYMTGQVISMNGGMEW